MQTNWKKVGKKKFNPDISNKFLQIKNGKQKK